jgi:hypothetical protein
MRLQIRLLMCGLIVMNPCACSKKSDSPAMEPDKATETKKKVEAAPGIFVAAWIRPAKNAGQPSPKSLLA